MDLKKILDMWAEDCQIDKHRLDESSRATPALHAKYLALYADAKLQLTRSEAKQKIILKDKWLYYNGKMDQDQLEEKGWEPDPFNGLKILKGEMDHYYDSDPEIQRSEEVIQYYKTLIDTLSEIIDNLKWRHQTISNIIRWKQFEAGG